MSATGRSCAKTFDAGISVGLHPLVPRDHALSVDTFVDIGKRMLLAWAEGVQGLRDQRVYAVGEWQVGEAFEGFSEPPKLKMATTQIGRSPLLAGRSIKKSAQ